VSKEPGAVQGDFVSRHRAVAPEAFAFLCIDGNAQRNGSLQQRFDAEHHLQIDIWRCGCGHAFLITHDFSPSEARAPPAMESGIASSEQSSIARPLMCRRRARLQANAQIVDGGG
jgi:hypothetical protein